MTAQNQILCVFKLLGQFVCFFAVCFRLSFIDVPDMVRQITRRDLPWLRMDPRRLTGTDYIISQVIWLQLNVLNP